MSRGSVRGFGTGRLPRVAVLAALLAACAAGEVEDGVGAPRLGHARQPLGEGDAGLADGGLAGDAAPPAADGGALAAENDCCSTGSTGGCSDATLLSCVCEGDPFCCSTEYDAVCVTQAQSRCGLTCNARPPESDCCAASEVPGCTEPDVQACVCGIDPFCCLFRFDESCVNLAAARCEGGCSAVPSP